MKTELVNLPVFCAPLGDGQSALATGGDEREAQENKFLLLTGSRNQTQGICAGRCGEAPVSARGRRAAPSGAPRPWPLLEFTQERQGREGEEFRIGQFESFWWPLVDEHLTLE